MNLLTLDWNALFLASMVALAVLLVSYFLGKERTPLQDVKEMEVMEGWLPTAKNINGYHVNSLTYKTILRAIK